MKKLLILALTLIPTSLQAQTYNQVQWGINKASSPYPVAVNVNNVWGQLGTLSAAGQWAIPTSNIVGPCGLSIFACANTWTALQTFTTTLLGTAPTIPTGFTPPLATWNSAYPGLTARADPFRFDVGGFPINNEFYGAYSTHPTIRGVQALVGLVKTPLGATSDCGGGAPCQDVGVAAYSQGAEPTRSSVALFAQGGISANGLLVEGANIVSVNCENNGPTCGDPNIDPSKKGYNVLQSSGVEVNVVAYDTSPGVPPTGTFYGVQALLNRGPGNIVPVSSVAYAANNFAGAVGWGTGFQCASGAASSCLVVGATAVSGTSKNSQPIQFVSLNSGGAPITSPLFMDSAGSLQFNNTAGGYTHQLNTAYPQIRLLGVNNTQVGQSVSTSATSSAVASYILQTGTAGSTMSANLFNAGNMNYTGGTNVNSIVFQLGSASPTNILTLTRNGGVQIGAPTSGDQGAGTLNATALYTNGGFFSASGTGAVVAKGNLTVGAVAGSTGAVAFTGTTSGVVTIKPQDTTNTYNFNLPTTVGTAGYLLTSQGGGASAMDWTSPTVTVNGTGCTLGSSCTVTAASSSIPFPITVSGTVTSGGIPYFDSTTQMSSSSVLAANALMIGGGAGAAPSTITTGTGVVTAIGNNTNTAGGLVVPTAALGSGQIVLGGGSGASPTTSANASIATGALTLGAAGTQGSVTMGGSTSGTLQVRPAAAAGTGSVLTLPGGTTDFSATGGTSQVVRQSTAGGALTVSQLAASDLSNGTTGSSTVVLSNTPTLTTPVLGAATGTSLALGTTLTSGQVLTVSGNTATSGYLYSGATSAPTNTTAGDITGTRLILGNVSTNSAFSLFRVSGSVAGTGAAPNTTAYAMYFDAAFTSATNYGWGIASNPQIPATGALTSLADFYAIGSTITAGGSVTNLIGFYVSTTLTGGTNNWGFRCQLAASGTARYCNYSDGTALNLFAGNTRIGGTTSPSYALDVTGDTNTSGVFRVGGTAGLTATKTVRDAAGTGTCTLIFTGGILTGGTC